MVNKVIAWDKKVNKSIFLLKVDFDKAFDNLNGCFLTETYTSPVVSICLNTTPVVSSVVAPHLWCHLLQHYTCGVSASTPHLWCHLPQHLTCGVICHNTTPAVSSHLDHTCGLRSTINNMMNTRDALAIGSDT
ncbi:hypothetical protein OSB04_011067 [Centaurea solstitialis]|uniref:Reverse transcriptase domain-containing protein n=1 Tax=Centaurea solstitialis TaxID=347529 RepID=A0AA38T8R0_9ASTR|nr:hypothetical protein OSB04_011067 [Centaurea solstitialis]